MRNKVTCAALLSVLSAPALASNFSYSHLGVDLGQATPDDDLILEGETYDSIGFFSAGGGYQFTENVALSLSSSAYLAEEGNTDFTYTFVEFYLHFPIAVSDNINITPFVGLRRDEFEACIGAICVTDDESGGSYGLAVRAWVVSDKFELNASYTDSNQDGFDSEIEIGMSAYINKNNSIQVNYMTEDFISRFAVGYRYYW